MEGADVTEGLLSVSNSNEWRNEIDATYYARTVKTFKRPFVVEAEMMAEVDNPELIAM